MKAARFKSEVEALLKNSGVLTVEDFATVCKGMPMPSVYSRIRSLVKNGQLSVLGKGKYLAVPKPAYTYQLSPWILEVNTYLISACEGVNHCLRQNGANLIVEVGREDRQRVLDTLKHKYPKTALQKEARHFPGPLEGYVLVDSLVTDSPIAEVSGVPVSALEKMWVDTLAEKKAAFPAFSFQKTMEVYPINRNRMARYAARRGLSEELKFYLDNLNEKRIELFATVQRYLSTLPVSKAWVFGSFARGEERDDSDLDLLIEYKKDSKLSLLKIVRYQLDLKKLIDRDVDWVEDGYLKPFAIPSANKEKYLIYEGKD